MIDLKFAFNKYRRISIKRLITNLTIIVFQATCVVQGYLFKLTASLNGRFAVKIRSKVNFALRQIQEKCRLHGQDLYLVFIDLTKAFDTINRESLWCILDESGLSKAICQPYSLLI